MVAIEIKGCPKQIHFITVWDEVQFTRYGVARTRYEPRTVTDSDCPCRRKIRQEMNRDRAR